MRNLQEYANRCMKEHLAAIKMVKIHFDLT